MKSTPIVLEDANTQADVELGDANEENKLKPDQPNLKTERDTDGATGTIPTVEAYNRLQVRGGLVVLDCRSREEWVKKHVCTAFNWPVTETATRDYNILDLLNAMELFPTFQPGAEDTQDSREFAEERLGFHFKLTEVFLYGSEEGCEAAAKVLKDTNEHFRPLKIRFLDFE